MQIELENASSFPDSSRVDGEPTNTSQVTDRGRHELVDPSCPLTADDLSAVAEFRRKAEANGWGPFLRRLHSPWSRGARPESRGKQPVGRDWQAQKSDPELHNPRAWSANTGMLTAGLRAFDIDVDDPATVDEIVAVIARDSGGRREGLMIRSRPNSPRVSVLFRAAEGASKKRVLVGRDKHGSPAKIEVLGDGQQFVVDGWHASRLDGSARITWQNSPADTSPNQVAAISAEQVDSILREIAIVLHEPEFPPPSNGRTASRIPTEEVFEIPGGKLAAVFANAPRCRDELAYHDQLGQADIRSCLDATPNNRIDWDWWNTIGMRVYAACNGEDYGLEEWTRWSATAPGNPGKDTCEARWEHFHNSPPTRTGIGALIAGVRSAVNEPDWMPDGASYYARGEFPLAQPGGSVPPEGVTSQGNTSNAGSSGSAAAVDPYACEVLDPNDPPPRHRQWKLGTKAIAGECTIIAGKGGWGKSAYVISLAFEAASGLDILGECAWGGPMPVLYINSEDDTEEIRRRLIAVVRHHQIPNSALANVRFRGVNTPGHQPLTGGDDNSPRMNDAGFAVLDNILAARRPGILILDPLGTFCPAGINNNGLMGQVLLRLKQLAKKYECAILIVHHTRKDGDLTNVDAIGGASAIVNQARAAYMIVRMTKDDAKNFRGVMESALWQYIRIIDAKTNLAPPSSDTQWYQLISYTLPNPEPPIYPHGDRVQVVAKLELQHLNISPAGPVIDDFAKRAILAAAHDANPPFSPSSKGGSHRYITKNVLGIVRNATGLPWTDRDLTKHIESLIKEMTNAGWLRVEDTKVGRNTRKGFVVDWLLTPWKNEFVSADDQMLQMLQMLPEPTDARDAGGIDARRPVGASNVPKGCGDLMQHRFDALPISLSSSDITGPQRSNPGLTSLNDRAWHSHRLNLSRIKMPMRAAREVRNENPRATPTPRQQLEPHALWPRRRRRRYRNRRIKNSRARSRTGRAGGVLSWCMSSSTIRTARNDVRSLVFK
jgi:hypothetical protein